MAEMRATLRRVGRGRGVVLAPAVIEAEGLTEGDELVLQVRKARAPHDVFGILSQRPLLAQAIKDRIRREDTE